MDMPNSNITIIDENESTLREQIIARIIAAALLEQVQQHNTNMIRKSIKTKESD